MLHHDDILSGGFLCHHAQSYLGFAFALCCVVLCCVVDLESCMLSCPGISVGEQSVWVGVPPRAANFSLKNVLSWVSLKIGCYTLIHTETQAQYA